ncbi:hypothetical protein [Curtobacterium sp. L1-20]|jgi:hypothetical protein|uniref:hypothetical protein n=1 Tax=Curtobacterium sp. L1-20 TaxID=3138181 RepID=UPI003B5256E0
MPNTTTYESNDDVQPVRVTTYRHLRKATRRGWALPTDAEPSLGDLVRIRQNRSTDPERSQRS